MILIIHIGNGNNLLPIVVWILFNVLLKLLILNIPDKKNIIVNSNKLEMTLTDFEKGIYFIRLIMEDSNFILKKLSVSKWLKGMAEITKLII